MVKASTQFISWDKIRRMKSADRKRDWNRLARKEVSATKLQRTFSTIPYIERFLISNLSKMAKAIRRQRRSRTS